MNIKKIKFKNVEDYRKIIASLWQNQKKDESYDFIFPDEESKKEFDYLVKAFEEGNKK